MANDEGTKVYVGQLNELTDEKELRDSFERFPSLTRVWVARNPAGFAFLWYSDSHDAEEAVRQFNGSEIRGQIVREFTLFVFVLIRCLIVIQSSSFQTMIIPS